MSKVPRNCSEEAAIGERCLKGVSEMWEIHRHRSFMFLKNCGSQIAGKKLFAKETITGKLCFLYEMGNIEFRRL